MAGCGRHSYGNGKLAQQAQQRDATCAKQDATASYKQMLSKRLFHPSPPATEALPRPPTTNAFCRHMLCAHSSKDTKQAHHMLKAAKNSPRLPGKSDRLPSCPALKRFLYASTLSLPPVHRHWCCREDVALPSRRRLGAFLKRRPDRFTIFLGVCGRPPTGERATTTMIPTCRSRSNTGMATVKL